MKNDKCSAKKTVCPCQQFSKEGLCDWPYSQDMNYQECHKLSVAMKIVGDLYDDCKEVDDDLAS